MLIVHRVPKVTGWSPISYMVQLAAELFEADLLLLDRRRPNLLKQLEALTLGRQRAAAGETCLFICSSPGDLLYLLTIQDWRKRFRYVSAWIVDSFWTDWIPGLMQLAQPFDQLFVTTEEDIPAWTAATKTPVTWLPWGTDVLRLGGRDTERSWDLTRVGRQPPEWEDDSLTDRACFEQNLRFHGRPTLLEHPQENQEMLMALYRQTKFLLAFSNAVNPTFYTHPSREYITARWVDALACGAVVAGVPPKEPSIDRLLWSGATLNTGTIRREDGLRVIAEANHNWQPEQAEQNYRHALERLDWRWRFSTIANACQESPKLLEHELQLLRQKIKQESARNLGEKSEALSAVAG